MVIRFTVGLRTKKNNIDVQEATAGPWPRDGKAEEMCVNTVYSDMC